MWQGITEHHRRREESGKARATLLAAGQEQLGCKQ
jgi:hypothetical protein